MSIRKFPTILKIAAAAVVVAFSSTAAADNCSTHKAEKTIVDIAVSDSSFETLTALLGEAGLVDALNQPGPLTVFAPTDEAFAKVDADTLQALKSDKALLTKVLTYHVVSGKYKAEKVIKKSELTTLAEIPVPISTNAEGVYIGGAKVVQADVAASNGVVHVIDTVLIPAAEKNLVETAIDAGQFTTLATLLTKADLVDTLTGKGPFTVFAPTDEAFKAVPQETLDALAANPGQLRAVLLYHVVPGKVTAEKVVTLNSAETAQGSDVTIKSSYGNVMINDARVVEADVMAGNGVIHVIDKVILPPA